MKSKKMFGIVLLIVGIVMLGASFYIKGQVGVGRIQISNAQRNVDSGTSIFSMTPATNQVGKGLFGGAQGRIDAGTQQADYYDQMAGWLQIGGVLCIIVGGALIFFSSRKR